MTLVPAKDQKITLIGLYTTDKGQLEEFADKVDFFNRGLNKVVVEMFVTPDEGNEVIEEPHWQINLEFPTRMIQTLFYKFIRTYKSEDTTEASSLLEQAVDEGIV